MNRKHLTALFAVASMSLSAGCASGWPKSLSWSRPKASSESTADYTAPAPSRGLALLGKKAGSEELSPEFKAAQKNFKDPEKSLLAWARYQEDIGEYAEARKKYRELQIAYPNNIEASVGLARIETLTGRTRQAEQQLNALAAKHPKNGDIQLELGALYSRSEDFPKAIRAYERACEIDPQNEAYQYELGIALVKHGQFDEGLSHLAFSVGDSAAHYNIGYILHEQGNDADAIEWFRNALDLHPDKQTAERAEAMLANLQSVERGSSGEFVSKSSGTQRGRRDVEPNEVAAMPMRSNDSGRARLATNTMPLPAVEEDAVAANSRNASQNQVRRGTPLPPAIEGNELPPVANSSGPTESKPFRAVSWSSNHTQNNTQSGASVNGSVASGGHAEPPQWSGPSRRATPSQTSSDVQNPPAWRAYSGQ